MARVRITDNTDTERATVPLTKLVWEQPGINRQARGRVTIRRDSLNDISGLTPGRDRVYIEQSGTDTFGGILKTPGRSGGEPTLIVTGPWEYMDRAQSTPLGDEKVGADDSTLIEETVDATPELSKGTINTITSNETYIFSGVSQQAKARKVATTAGGELAFPPDLTVDYVSQIGGDKTGTILSPANQSFVEDTFNVDRDGIAGDTTHLEVFGVGQGSSQVSAAVVPADDSTTYSRYDTVKTYTNNDWSDGDEKDWDRRTNKDLKNADHAASWGQTLIDDLQDVEIRVTTVVKGTTVRLGDRFHVEHPEEGVDQDLRAVEVTTLIDSQGGERYEVTFSNYSPESHFDESEAIAENSGRYDQAYEGDLTNIQRGPGRGPVTPNGDYILAVKYPDDVVAEVNAELLIKGTNYRAPVEAAGHTHDVTHPSHDHEVTHPSHDHSISTTSGAASNESHDGGFSFSGSTTADDSITGNIIDTQTFDSGPKGFPFILDAVVVIDQGDGSEFEEVRLQAEDRATNTVYSLVSDTFKGDGFVHISGNTVVYDDILNNTFDLRLTSNYQSSSSASINYSWGYTAVPKHTHDVSETSTTALGSTETSTTALGTSETSTSAVGFDPGLNDWDGTDKSPALYPEDVDVLVNGNSQGTSFGDGSSEFEETVDLGGLLTAGWNVIRLPSVSKGDLDVVFNADLFRQTL